MVPMPAPVPLKPLTVATDSLVKRSEGKTFAIVVKQAYENVESPNKSVIRNKFTVKMVGMRRSTPVPPKTTSALRAAPSDHPRLSKYPETPPPTKLPRSAAMNGTHTAIKPLLREMPLATR